MSYITYLLTLYVLFPKWTDAMCSVNRIITRQQAVCSVDYHSLGTIHFQVPLVQSPHIYALLTCLQ